MKNETKNQPSEAIKKFSHLVEGIKVAMLTTVDENGKLRSRPMATQEVSFNGDLWFFLSCKSAKVNEVKKTKQVQVSYADSHKNRYISVSGTAELVREPEKIKELWSPIYQAWFPKGLDEPDLALLKVKVEDIEYWDTPSSAMVHLIGLAKAKLTGHGYEGEGMEHERLKNIS